MPPFDPAGRDAARNVTDTVAFVRGVRGWLGVVLLCALIAAACGSDPESNPNDEQPFPDVIAANATRDGEAWNFSATISSPYDTPQRYADAWRIIAPDGSVLGTRDLAHDHAGEQPFTRSLTGVEVPSDVGAVTIEGRDRVNGWGGGTVAVDLSEP
jgi:hypothetical protein